MSQFCDTLTHALSFHTISYMDYTNRINKDYMDRVNRVLVYIKKNYSSPLSLEEMASEANFSTFHFHRIFYSIMGETPVQFQRRIRLEDSAKELYNSETAIKQISSKYGFSSPAVYSRDFKKHFGETPLALRGKLISRLENKSSISEINLKTIHSFTMAYSNVTGFKQIIPAFIKLAITLKRQLIKPGKKIEYIYDNQYITPKEKCRYDIGYEVLDKTLNSSLYNLRKTPKNLYAVLNLKGRTVKIDDCFDKLFSWLIRSEYEIVDLPLLIVFNKLYSLKPVLPIDYTNADICIPVKKQDLHSN